MRFKTCEKCSIETQEERQAREENGLISESELLFKQQEKENKNLETLRTHIKTEINKIFNLYSNNYAEDKIVLRELKKYIGELK